MQEGWLVSDGEVIASAVLHGSVLASLLPAGAERLAGAATVVRPHGLVLTTALRGPTSLLTVGDGGLVTGIWPLRSWRAKLVPHSTRLAVLLATPDVERVRLEAGRSLEFREGR